VFGEAQTHRHSQMFAAIVEQRRLLRSADQPPRERSRRDASVLIEFAKTRHRLLEDAPPDPHTAHAEWLADTVCNHFRVVHGRKHSA